MSDDTRSRWGSSPNLRSPSRGTRLPGEARPARSRDLGRARRSRRRARTATCGDPTMNESARSSPERSRTLGATSPAPPYAPSTSSRCRAHRTRRRPLRGRPRSRRSSSRRSPPPRTRSRRRPPRAPSGQRSPVKRPRSSWGTWTSSTSITAGRRHDRGVRGIPPDAIFQRTGRSLAPGRRVVSGGHERRQVPGRPAGHEASTRVRGKLDEVGESTGASGSPPHGAGALHPAPPVRRRGAQHQVEQDARPRRSTWDEREVRRGDPWRSSPEPGRRPRCATPRSPPMPSGGDGLSRACRQLLGATRDDRAAGGPAIRARA